MAPRLLSGDWKVLGQLLQGPSTTAPVSLAGALSSATDAMMGLICDGTSSLITEAAYIFYARDAAGTLQKMGVLSSQWINNTTATGYAYVNIHATYHSAPGVTADYLGVTVFGGKGVTINPNSLTDEPPAGCKTYVRGLARFVAGIQIDSAGAVIYGESTISYDTNAIAALLSLRNSSTGTGASSRVNLGNNVSALAATFSLYGGNHATQPNWLVLFNELSAPLLFGTNGTERMRIDANGYVSLTTRFAFNGKTPIASVAAPAVATDLATVITLANDLRTRGINIGVYT